MLIKELRDFTNHRFPLFVFTWYSVFVLAVLCNQRNGSDVNWSTDNKYVDDDPYGDGVIKANSVDPNKVLFKLIELNQTVPPLFPRYDGFVKLCFSQMNPGHPDFPDDWKNSYPKAFDFQLESSCEGYMAYCEGLKGCCSFDQRPLVESCDFNIDCPQAVTRQKQCSSLVKAKDIPESGRYHFFKTCMDVCAGRHVPMFTGMSLDKKGTSYEHPGGQYLEKNEHQKSRPYRPKVLLRGYDQDYQTSCQIDMLRDRYFASIITRQNTIKPAVYRWAVYNNGTLVDPTTTSITPYGEILINVNSSAVEVVDYRCYVERVAHVEGSEDEPREVANSTADQTPADQTPADQTPADQTPTDQTPTNQTPTDQTPADQTPTDRTPTDQTPTDQTPTDQTPADQTPTDRTPTDQTPTDRTPTDRTPTDRTPTDRTPTDRTPILEAIGFAEPYIPPVIDPVNNFLTQSIKKFTLEVNQVIESEYRATCTFELKLEPQLYHYTRHIWMGLLLYRNVTLDHKSRGSGRFVRSEVLEKKYIKLISQTKYDPYLAQDVLLYPERGLPEDLQMLEGNYTLESALDVGRNDGTVTCVFHTEMAHIVRKFPVPGFTGRPTGNVTRPTGNVTRHTRESTDLKQWVVYGPLICVVVLIIVLSIIIYRKRLAQTVIVQLVMNPDYHIYGALSGASVTQTSGQRFPISDSAISEDDEYLPMTNTRLDTVDETESFTLTPPSSFQVYEDNIEGCVDMAPSTSGARSRGTLVSVASSIDSSRPSIAVEPKGKYEPFTVTFDKLDGDSNKVLLKNQKYNVRVPDQLNSLKVSQRRIALLELIGTGNFGQVYRGTLTPYRGSPIVVAVKVLKASATFDALKDLVVEGTCMALTGNHKNIVSLEAVCFKSEKPCLATEFCLHGDLKNLLSKTLAMICEAYQEQAKSMFYKWISDIGAGVEYLHMKKIVHRDLACRNCLITEDLTCKVADFGLARDMGDSMYYNIQTASNPLPYRWLAPEVLKEQKFNTSTDVWSFAVTVWEICTFGCHPYPGIINSEALSEYLQTGGRLQLPSWVDKQLVLLISQCFTQSQVSRPSMTHLQPILVSIANRLYHSSVNDIITAQIESIVTSPSTP